MSITTSVSSYLSLPSPSYGHLSGLFLHAGEKKNRFLLKVQSQVAQKFLKTNARKLIATVRKGMEGDEAKKLSRVCKKSFLNCP